MSRKPWAHRRYANQRIVGTALRVRNKAIKERDGYRCQMCGALRTPEDLEIDHILPLCRGGGDEESNLQSLCKSPCHENKTAIDIGHRVKPPIGVDGWPVETGDDMKRYHRGHSAADDEPDIGGE